MALGATLQLFAAMGGITTWQYYLPTVAESYLGLRIRASNIVVTASTTWLVVCAFLGVFVIERLGRRGTIMFSFAGLFFCSIILLGLMLVGLGNHTDIDLTTATGRAVMAFIFVFLGFWGLLYPATWLYQAEINTWTSRAVGSAVATIVMYVGNILSAFYTPALVVGAGTATGSVFLAINFLALLFTYLLIPETAGRSLEWLDYYYSRKPPLLVIKDPKATKRRWQEEMEVMEVASMQAPAGSGSQRLTEGSKDGFVTAEMMSLHSSRSSRKDSENEIASVRGAQA